MEITAIVHDSDAHYSHKESVMHSTLTHAKHTVGDDKLSVCSCTEQCCKNMSRESYSNSSIADSNAINGGSTNGQILLYSIIISSIPCEGRFVTL